MTILLLKSRYSQVLIGKSLIFEGIFALALLVSEKTIKTSTKTGRKPCDLGHGVFFTLTVCVTERREMNDPLH